MEQEKQDLLHFLEPNEAALSVLVIESVRYLPRLRALFPNAALYAVAADEDARGASEAAGLDVRWTTLDYRETPLPFAQKSFDIVLSERMLEHVTNPQDIASGIGTFIKDTGFLLTSFENIRHWRVLKELMEGHYYAIIRRRYTVSEFSRLMSASFYKDVFFAPVRRPSLKGEVERLMAAGFENRMDDLDTEVWLVQAMRSSASVAPLKAAYTPEARKRLALLLRRVEYDIDARENVEALWRLADEAGLSEDYIARFAAEIIVQRAAFDSALVEHTPDTRIGALQKVIAALEEKEV